MGDENRNIDPNTVMANFIEHQTQINKLNSKFFEDTRKSQESTAEVLKMLMEAYQAQPPRKKRKVGDEGEGENSASHPDSIALTIAPSEEIEDITKDSEGTDFPLARGQRPALRRVAQLGLFPCRFDWSPVRRLPVSGVRKTRGGVPQKSRASVVKMRNGIK